MKSSKIISTIVLLIGVISFVFYWYMIKLGGDTDAANPYIDKLIGLTKVLLYVAVIAAVVGFILDIFESKKSAIYMLISFAVLGVIFLIAYSKATFKPYTLNDHVYSASVSGWSDAGLWMFYILAFIALALMLFTWIVDFVRGQD